MNFTNFHEQNQQAANQTCLQVVLEHIYQQQALLSISMPET